MPTPRPGLGMEADWRFRVALVHWPDVTEAPDGTNVRRIVAPDPGSWARSPAWSPDGRWIAYVSGTSGDDGNIFIVPSSGGQPRQVTFDCNTYDWRPVWPP